MNPLNMKRMKPRYIVIIPFLFLQIHLFAQDTTEISSACIEKIDSTYKALLEKNKVVGMSIALVKNGKIIYSQGFGFQDKEKKIKADENTVYRIGSCSKSFTALSLLQLQEKGLVNLSSPIQNYLPELKIHSRFSNQNPIIISSLLSHTSGLTSDILNGFFCDNPPSMDWLIEQLNLCTMSAPANYQHSYSNVGYGILGKLITSLSHQDYGQYLQENIFEPLQMTSSFVDDTNNTSPNMSIGYVDKKAVDETQIRDQAAGLIASSVNDMSKYVMMLLARGQGPNDDFISSASIEEMQQNATANLTLPTSSEWGYGLYSENLTFGTDKDTTVVKMIGHGGDTWAFHADFKYIPELNIGAIVLTNTDNGASIANAKRLLGIYLREMQGKKQIVVPKKSNNSRDQICAPNEVLGKYHFSDLTMEVKNTKKIKISQGPHKVIFKEKNDSLQYTGKIRLFNLVPMKLKDQEFKFVKLEEQVYLKGVQLKSGNEEYLSIKSKSLPINDIWEKKIGKYETISEIYKCEDCAFLNFEGLTFELKEKKGQLIVSLKSKDKSANGEMSFEIISDTFAVTPGIGRNTGETLRILENGNLFYSGFEFKLK
jgi:CubicO group peptidase (beta-lactamase class C family)